MKIYILYTIYKDLYIMVAVKFIFVDLFKLFKSFPGHISPQNQMK